MQEMRKVSLVLSFEPDKEKVKIKLLQFTGVKRLDRMEN
jgi:hypothetical protein